MAASFWLDVADFRQALLDQEQKNSEAAKTAEVDDDEADKAVEGDKDKAAKAAEDGKTAEKDKAAEAADGDKAAKAAEEFALAFASYDPDDCRARA
ncbi:MAG: hypothetical protein GX937_08990, partial [Lentisphaerae bacterium]|nr:hypothetical protein [Lentisphaerota bacterium]